MDRLKGLDLGRLDRILRPMLERKLELGLPIHLNHPGLRQELDITRIEYVHTLLDGVIELRKEEHKALMGKSLECYGVPQLFVEVFKDEKRALGEWFAICHKVSECPDEVLEYCREVLSRAGKPVPKKIPATQLMLVAAE